ncbi:MOSC N-terminal beta barrel domain-containing protein [Aquabacterium sp. A7-Y]|uniref:MOSC domain-containing protein n=1 Tax=Aquabacterium sp. A7-Y TaxID=1349605 RepID=UPI00223E7568|nr:MOSC N-terminal beta barrel domain-containing protein [Aquabacterium sp. A7-Y]MCW7537064.1 MOSC N-terminal beta barrel domain-containing protein [Aquabacterium sp. A7-Y]
MSDPTFVVTGLYVYPIKSCAGVSLPESLIIETGLEFDRAWMVVDEEGSFVTQRELPRMALIRPTLRHTDMVLRAPGMLALHVAYDSVEEAVRVRLWNEVVRAYDMGDLAAQWFSDFLGRRLRLVRFDPEFKRLSDPKWTDGREAENQFSDGYPYMVVSQSSLDALNDRLLIRGRRPVAVERFRPNIVIAGDLDPHAEDYFDELQIETGQGLVRLQLVKPCTRCTIPNVDPLTGETGHEPGDTLATYRSDARLDGAVTFGMNAIMLQGLEHLLTVGGKGRASLNF